MNIVERINRYLLESGDGDADAPLHHLFSRAAGSGGADWGVQAWHVSGKNALREPGDSGHFITNDDDASGTHTLIHRTVGADNEYRDKKVASGSREHVVDKALDLQGRAHAKTSGPATVTLVGHRARGFMAAHHKMEKNGDSDVTDYLNRSEADHIDGKLPYHLHPGKWSASLDRVETSPHDLDGLGKVHVRVTPV